MHSGLTPVHRLTGWLVEQGRRADAAPLVVHLPEQPLRLGVALRPVLRTLCFVGAVLASLAGIDWLWPFLIAGALVLPYIAVVMANAAANLTDGFKLREADFSRRELEPGRSSHASEL